jgi:hypothetical protein
MTIKRIAFNMPFNSEGFNLKDNQIFQTDAVITGMTVSPCDANSVNVSSGTFIYGGIIVQDTIATTVTTSGITTVGYIIATTPDSQGTTYSITATSVYTSGAIIATYNGTEWIEPKRINLADISSYADRVFESKGVCYSQTYTNPSTTVIKVDSPHAVFPSGRVLDSAEEYSLTLTGNTVHHVQHSICAYEEDGIMQVDTFPAGTLCRTNGTYTTAITGISGARYYQVAVAAIDGNKFFEVCRPTAGTTYVKGYYGSNTNGTCTLLGANFTLNVTNVTDFAICNDATAVYVLYVNGDNNLYLSKFTEAVDVHVTIHAGTNVSLPAICIFEGVLHCACLDSIIVKLLKVLASDISVGAFGETINVLTDTSMSLRLCLLRRRNKIYWMYTSGVALNHVLKEFETNIAGGSATTPITSAALDVAIPQIKADKWGNVYKSYVQKIGSGNAIGYVLIDTGYEVYTKSFDIFGTGAQIEYAQMSICPMEFPGVLVSTQYSVGSHSYYRLNYKAEIEAGFPLTIMSGAVNGVYCDVAALKSGAAAFAIADSGTKSYVSYVPTALASTEFIFPNTGLELVRATTNLSNAISLMFSPNDPNVDGVKVTYSGTTENQITKKYVDPYYGIQRALAISTPTTDSGRMVIEVNGSQHYPLSPIVMKAYTELRGKNSYIATHALWSGTELLTGESNSIIAGCNISGAAITKGVVFTTKNNFSIVDSIITGTTGLTLATNCTNYKVVDNDVTSSSGDAIVIT